LVKIETGTRRGAYIPRHMPTQPDTTPLFISVAKAADELGLDPRTVRDAVEKGQIPGRRIGRRVLIPRKAITRLVVEAE
jgi:excisionase family DNA binding protein